MVTIYHWHFPKNFQDRMLFQQAFWLFSVDACGAYGFDGLTVFHSGRTAPVGEVTLSSSNKMLKIDKGSGMLLLVGGGGAEQAQAHVTPSRGAGQ